METNNCDLKNIDFSYGKYSPSHFRVLKELAEHRLQVNDFEKLVT